jgi:outer membrane protein
MRKFIQAAVVVAGLTVAGMGQGYAQQKFAHLNSGELLSLMPEMAKADAAYNEFYKQKQTLLQGIDGERTKKVNLYNEKKKTLSEANQAVVGKELETLAAEIGEIEKRLEESSAKADSDVKEKRDELYQPVFDKATSAIKAVAKEKGYAYVFDTNAQAQVLLYFDGGEDILSLVKTKLGIPATAVPAAQTQTAPKNP